MLPNQKGMEKQSQFAFKVNSKFQNIWYRRRVFPYFLKKFDKNDHLDFPRGRSENTIFFGFAQVKSAFIKINFHSSWRQF